MRHHTIDDRMESFVDASGVVPPEAHRLDDFEARCHADAWIQRLIGQGIACHQVVGYAHGRSWWTFCFDRRAADEIEDGNEIWRVEAYDSIGRGWSDTFTYCTDTGRWRWRLPASQAAAPRIDGRRNS
jgi:hypothetical protein